MGVYEGGSVRGWEEGAWTGKGGVSEDGSE